MIVSLLLGGGGAPDAHYFALTAAAPAALLLSLSRFEIWFSLAAQRCFDLFVHLGVLLLCLWCWLMAFHSRLILLHQFTYLWQCRRRVPIMVFHTNYQRQKPQIIYSETNAPDRIKIIPQYK